MDIVDDGFDQVSLSALVTEKLKVCALPKVSVMVVCIDSVLPNTPPSGFSCNFSLL